MSNQQYIKSLELENFSILPNEKLNFSSGLNVIVAENACGKSHLLKILYCLLSVTSDSKNRLLKTDLQKAFADKLSNVFRPDSLGRLVKRRQGRNRADISLILNSGEINRIDFSTNSSSQVNIQDMVKNHNDIPAFIPTRELITLCPWFVSLYNHNHIPFDETWHDTCQLLGLPIIKGARAKQVQTLLKPLESAMDARVKVDKSGRFYLGNVEASLVAEGVRKLMMLAHLISTGSLLDKGYLFWDEPEANLNPKLIKTIAKTIFDLSQSNIQIFITTHSLFLLRELEILKAESKNKNTEGFRYFSLSKEKDGEVTLQQTSDFYNIDDLVLLDESLAQSDRYLMVD